MLEPEIAASCGKVVNALLRSHAYIRAEDERNAVKNLAKFTQDSPLATLIAEASEEMNNIYAALNGLSPREITNRGNVI